MKGLDWLLLPMKSLAGQARQHLACRLFVEIAPDTLGLVHVTNLEVSRFGSVADWEVGDTLDCKVLEASLYLCMSRAPSYTPREGFRVKC